MAFVINYSVQETTTTTGTGAFALGGAVQGFETFGTGTVITTPPIMLYLIQAQQSLK